MNRNWTAVISSVEEARAIKKACRPRISVVTPGIRLAKATDDQKRGADASGRGERRRRFFL